MIYTDKKLNQISFPLGGIGSGSISIKGNGALSDWEIYNRPNKGKLNGTTFISVLVTKPSGEKIFRVLNSDYNIDLMGKYSEKSYIDYGHGPDLNTMCGFPHFKNAVFDARFPIAKITFTDETFPGKIILKAWSPLIPLDSYNSSLPCAFFNIELEDVNKEYDYKIIFVLNNPFDNTINIDESNDKYSIVKLKENEYKKNDIGYGDITIGTDSKTDVYPFLYRSDSKERINTFLHDLFNGNIKKYSYSTSNKGDMCALITDLKDTYSVKYVLSWNVPNCYNYWDPYKDDSGKDIIWKNYYATIFESSLESFLYSMNNYNDLYNKTLKFVNTLYSCSLDDIMIDAISSNLAVLKSSTCSRLEDGSLYGFEGTNTNSGSCEGTCTHVWSYAYALCFLFPDLERSIRDTEFKYDIAEDGRMRFRTILPLGRKKENKPHCLDGQVLTIVKTYREWLISGDDEWLLGKWENLKKLIKYIWSDENVSFWDHDEDGILEGRQHHTLDSDLMGPSSWLEGLYLLALDVMCILSKHFNDEELYSKCLKLYNNGKSFVKENLFNGEYFIQKIDIKDHNLVSKYDCDTYWNEDRGELRYQIGDGCEIDQMLADWHSSILSLGKIFDKQQKDTALDSILKYNYKKELRNVLNSWRVFALNGESGLIMCDYPHGAPISPIQYHSECMTGFEYALSGLLASEGKIKESIEIVKNIRNRYDGEKRNPFSEIECGGNYARSMASFAFLPIFSGFIFDMPNKKIGFKPIINGNSRFMFSLDCAWGEFIRENDKTCIKIIDGKMTLKELVLPKDINVNKVVLDNKEIEFKKIDDTIYFDETTIKDSIMIS